MLPTLVSGDRILVDPAAFRNHPLRRNVLVVVRSPEPPALLVVKRLVGLPGDPVPSVESVGVNVVVPLAGVGVVPPRHVYVLSDAPEHGRDSRQFGPVPFQALIGEAWWRYAPPARRGPLA